MKRLKTLFFLLPALVCSVLQAAQTDNSFASLLSEAGLGFVKPEQYHAVTVHDSELFPYEHSIRHDNNKLEIRYSIRPLARIEIDYEDPHNAAPEPNHIFTMMFTALIGQLSSGGNSPHREYNSEEARQKFNADWAALSVFDVEQSYSPDYRQAFLVALHKNNLSDAYIIILFNDYSEIKADINQAIQTLRFN